jgi:two-component system, OmpR family, KDP operon response regulator KdpE
VNASPAAVLLVEDGADLGPLLRETLEEWQHRAILARTGADAMEVLAREPVSLILLDHDLPDMTGQDLLEALRSQHRVIPPVVLMTGDRRPVTRESFPELVEVLPKPFELAELARMLKRRLPHR